MNTETVYCSRCGRSTTVETSMAVIKPPKGESKRGELALICSRCLYDPEPQQETMEKEG